jgi:hypothetical protein
MSDLGAWHVHAFNIFYRVDCSCRDALRPQDFSGLRQFGGIKPHQARYCATA